MNAEAELETLSSVIGVELKLEEGAASFEYEGRLVLLRSLPEIESWLVYIALSEPGPALPALMPELLKANFLLSASRGGAFSLDPGGALGLNFLVPTGSGGGQALVNALNRALNTADLWRARIEQLIAENVKKDAARLQTLNERGAAEDGAGDYQNMLV
ncbi:MAG: type III secretion system chaperone [Succinivibrio sp.]|nr:type III secretion system chaperone [Succinivibrio sp.]